MKIVVAMDSFKGSVSSVEAGQAVKRGIEKVCDAQVTVKPIADGGEGTVEALVEGLGGQFADISVTGPLGGKIQARYGLIADGKTAVIEMAEAAGITLVERESLNPWDATTFGVGEMIRAAIEKGCREFIIGIGGSATTDGGVGMLQALGYEFLNAEGQQVSYGIRELDSIRSIKSEKAMKELSACQFLIACDVTNPLCGETGAVYIYGPQKGVKQEEKEVLDQKMVHYGKLTEQHTGKNYMNQEGAGAAGGLGFAFLSYVKNVELRSGISIVLEALKLEEAIKEADLVITGEGRLDGQTAMGKVPIGIAKLAKKYGASVLAFAGGVTEDADACNAEGIDAFFPIVRSVVKLEEAMEPENAKKNIVASVEQVLRAMQIKITM